MSKKIDLHGKVFGRLTVVSESQARDSHGNVVWNCLCECGNTKATTSSNLRTGQTKSCGCLFLEVAAEKGRKKATHNMTDSKTYTVWVGMKGRCLNAKNPKYANYGKRGIRVCDRWMTFEGFLADMGECPEGMSIERKNVNGDYEPDNCIWADQKTQQNNRRDNVRLEFMGRNLTLAQWQDETGISQDAISWRIKNGWTVASALTNKPWGRGIVSHV